ncbi:unnamed protein product [Lathyrus oleraceus]
MDQHQRPNKYPTALSLIEPNNLKDNDDQCFLLYFIMGTYFGPHINGEKKSVLQRVAEGLPSYTREQLTSSFVKVSELERIYYYVLRNADKSLTVKLSFLRRFVKGLLECSSSNCNYPQFTDMFPLELHPQFKFKCQYRVIDSIVFIDNPEMFYLNSEEVERFKRLSGIEDFLVDIDAARLYNHFDGNGLRSKVRKTSSCRRVDESDDFSELKYQMPHAHVVKPIRSIPFNDGMALGDEGDSEKVDGPAVLFLPSRPTKKEWSNIVAATKNGFALTGSAATGRIGPIIGLVDIGECEDAYLFRMSLPGVKRDEKEFSCEVDTNGKVLIHGVTITGEKTVSMHSQVILALTGFLKEWL